MAHNFDPNRTNFTAIPGAKRNFAWQLDPGLLLRNSHPSLHANHIVQHVQQFMGSLGERGMRAVSRNRAVDIDHLGELLAFAINHTQQLEGTPETNRVEVRQSFADMSFDRPALVWTLDKRLPGQFSSGKIGTGRVRELMYHRREVIPDPQSASEVLIQSGKKMDNWVTLTICSHDATHANRLAIWLEDFMEEFMWYFCYMGYLRVIFEERTKDEFQEIAGHKFHCRPLKYFIQTEKVSTFRTSILRAIVWIMASVNAQSS